MEVTNAESARRFIEAWHREAPYPRPAYWYRMYSRSNRACAGIVRHRDPARAADWEAAAEVFDAAGREAYGDEYGAYVG